MLYQKQPETLGSRIRNTSLVQRCAAASGALALCVAAIYPASRTIAVGPENEPKDGFTAVNGDVIELTITGAGIYGDASRIRSTPTSKSLRNMCGYALYDVTVAVPAGELLTGEGEAYDGPELNDLSRDWVGFPIKLLPPENRTMHAFPLIAECGDGYVYTAASNVEYPGQ